VAVEAVEALAQLTLLVQMVSQAALVVSDTHLAVEEAVVVQVLEQLLLALLAQVEQQELLILVLLQLLEQVEQVEQVPQ